MITLAHRLIDFFGRPLTVLRSEALFEAGLIVLFSIVLMWGLSVVGDTGWLASSLRAVW